LPYNISALSQERLPIPTESGLIMAANSTRHALILMDGGFLDNVRRGLQFMICNK
jgi:hypothetical protein